MAGNRRQVLGGAAGLALAAASGALASARDARFAVHRFGVNYVPSRNWYYVWNDWRPDEVAQDFDNLASLGIDHLRVMLVWPWFQPNPAQVSPAHLDRLDALVRLAAARNLDVLVTVYTGWLSGFAFRPPWLPNEPFYEHAAWRAAQATLLTAVAGRMSAHDNFLGFDIGNEINVCWSTTPAVGDAWMGSVFDQMNSLAPGKVHVNGIDHQPWFEETTFSPAALVNRQPIVAIHSWPYWTGAARFGGHLDKPYTRLPSALAALVRAYAADHAKPVWLQEFGACKAEMPEADIPAWMDRTIESAVEEGVSWFTWWASHDVSRSFEFHPFEYDLGLFTADNRLKPSGEAYRRLVERFKGRPVRVPGRVLPPPPSSRTSDETWRWLLAHMASSD